METYEEGEKSCADVHKMYIDIEAGTLAHCHELITQTLYDRFHGKIRSCRKHGADFKCKSDIAEEFGGRELLRDEIILDMDGEKGGGSWEIGQSVKQGAGLN